MLENDVKDEHGQYEGVYIFEGFSDGMDYWVDTSDQNAIWYSTYYNDWAIGGISQVGMPDGTDWHHISSDNDLEPICPNNDILNWKYRDGFSWIATNDVHINCANEDDFRTSENLCELDEGDCDTHDECQVGLVCGSNNCPDSLGFHSEFDCCYAPTIGDEHFCASGKSCGEDQGDCDAHNECQDGLICGSNNCLDSEFDCCYQPTLGDENFCASGIPCGEDEGDCDSHAECQAGLGCGSDNCPASLGFDSEVDCCYQPTVGDEHFCVSGITCGEDEGDCDSNEECQAGLECNTAICPSFLVNNSLIDCCHISKIQLCNTIHLFQSYTFVFCFYRTN